MPSAQKRAEYMRQYYLKNKESLHKRQNAWTKEWRRNNPEKHAFQKWRGMLKKQYGITPEQYESMVIEQGYACAICKKISNQTERIPGKKLALHVDHCHKTKRIRGLLCGNCNTAIGLLKENTQFLVSAITYLTK